MLHMGVAQFFACEIHVVLVITVYDECFDGFDSNDTNGNWKFTVYREVLKKMNSNSMSK